MERIKLWTSCPNKPNTDNVARYHSADTCLLFLFDSYVFERKFDKICFPTVVKIDSG